MRLERKGSDRIFCKRAHKESKYKIIAPKPAVCKELHAAEKGVRYESAAVDVWY